MCCLVNSDLAVTERIQAELGSNSFTWQQEAGTKMSLNFLLTPRL